MYLKNDGESTKISRGGLIWVGVLLNPPPPPKILINTRPVYMQAYIQLLYMKYAMNI
jgi:hypothetical protein